MRLAFDIDGTLLQHPGHVDFLSGVSLNEAKPMPSCGRVKALIEDGHEVHFITGRCHPVRGVTLLQLQAHVHASIQDRHLTTQDTFLGYGAMADYKAKALQAIQAEGYVGDHAADRKAAALAGIPFMYAQEFEEGGAWP